MSHEELARLFLQLALMLACAVAGGQLMRLIRQPALLGELLGGVLLGPTLFGALAPGLHEWLFPVSGPIPLARDAIAKIGMLFFLFVAGQEVEPSHVLEHGKSTLLASLLGIAVPFATGFALVAWFPRLWGDFTPDHSAVMRLFIGTALSISALPVIARILMERGFLKERVGSVVLCAAMIDDVIGWFLFALILSTFTGAGQRNPLLTFLLVVLFVAVVFAAARVVTLRRVRKLLPGASGFVGATAVVVLVCAAAAEAIGIHAFLGAFVSGLALRQDADEPSHRLVYEFVMSFLAPIYFVSLGLAADFARAFDPLLVLVVLVAAFVCKIGGAGFGAWLGGMRPREATAVGFGMNARGAVEIVLASVALEHRLIDQRIFVALFVMALVTSMASGPVMEWLLPRSQRSAA